MNILNKTIGDVTERVVAHVAADSNGTVTLTIPSSVGSNTVSVMSSDDAINLITALEHAVRSITDHGEE